MHVNSMMTKLSEEIVSTAKGSADDKNLDSEEGADDGKGKEEGAICERVCNRCFLFASILAGIRHCFHIIRSQYGDHNTDITC